MVEGWIAARFIHFAASMVVFGIAAFRLYTVADETPEYAAFDRVLVKVTAAAAVVALGSAFAIVPFTAAEMAGSSTAAADPTMWRMVLFATAFGRVWCWHLGFASALLALCALPAGHWQVRTSAGVALLLLVSLGWVGHAAMDMGGSGAHKVNQMVHLAAGGIWLGGLVPLGLLLGRSVRGQGEAYGALAREALPHFSQMGYAAVGLVALTGTINSVMLVGSFDALVTTRYGQLLCVKIALFAIMVGLALINRFRLLPRLGRIATTSAALRALFRSVMAEQAIGLAILAVVSVLGTRPPAH